MRNLITTADFSVDELNSLMETARDISKNPEKYADKCRGKKLATLFFEPSTRTRLSFEAAMLELGGNVIGFSDAGSSSASKGESVADTAKIISCYADIMAMRHFKEGAPYVASVNASIPVINAGDGAHAHPTQTLADLFTIYNKKGTVSGLTVGLCGDLKNGRTVHSLIEAVSRYGNINFVLISPAELDLPQYVIDMVSDCKDITFTVIRSLDEALPILDVLYMTRIQRERFTDKDQYARLKDTYILDTKKLEHAKSNMIILHPLPRVNEISVAVDSDPRACYFEQALGGKYMRMALILKLLSETDCPDTSAKEGEVHADICQNPGCISSIEQELTPLYYTDDKGVCRCVYCDASK